MIVQLIFQLKQRVDYQLTVETRIFLCEFFCFSFMYFQLDKIRKVNIKINTKIFNIKVVLKISLFFLYHRFRISKIFTAQFQLISFSE